MTTTQDRAGTPGPTLAPGAEGAVPAAPPHRTGGAARTAGVVLAVLLVAAGVVAGQEALAAQSAAGLSPADGWLRTAVDDLDGTTLGSTAVAAGAVAVVVGVLLLAAAWRTGVRPARLRGAPTVEVLPQDVARLASAVADDVDGVLAASSTASRRSVVVRVRTTGDAGVPGEVREAVGARLADLDPAPQVRVRATTAGGAA